METSFCFYRGDLDWASLGRDWVGRPRFDEYTRDVESMREAFQDFIESATDNVLRTDPGWWNNLTSWFTDRLGCGQQATLCKVFLDSPPRGSPSYEHQWTFYQGFYLTSFPRQYLWAYTDDPRAPIVRIDPFRNEFEAYVVAWDEGGAPIFLMGTDGEIHQEYLDAVRGGTTNR